MAEPAPSRSALVAGASGLIGRALLDELLARPEYGRVAALARRQLPRSHPKLAQIEVDFDRLADAGERLRADDVFCCLGTTIRKAGSQEAFRRVDFDYPMALASAVKSAGAGQFLIVTSIGADPRSRVFYSRTKGEVEEALGRLELPALHVFRPAMLAGERDEPRPGERVGLALVRAMGPLIPRKYRAIEGRTVARAMVLAALRGETGRHVYESDRIARDGA